MRWDALFDDLSAQVDERAELRAQVADQVRMEWQEVTMLDRLATTESDVTISVAGESFTGSVGDVGRDWFSLRSSVRADVVLINAVNVAAVRNLGAWSDSAEVGRRRFGIATILRRLARDRLEVQLWTRDGEQIVGQLGRIGKDHVDIAIGDRNRRLVTTLSLAHVGVLRAQQAGN